MKDSWKELRERLLRGGVARQHVVRYVAELRDHAADLKSAEAMSDAEVIARLGGVDALAESMLAKPQLRSWSARVPWAVYGLMPVVGLLAAWVVALAILWGGWLAFLPNEMTPFMRYGGPAASFGFGVGRLIYFGAPAAAGWAIAWLAVRQRMRMWWPLAGMTIVAVMGATVVVRAWLAPHGHEISMGFKVGPLLDGESFIVWHFAVLLLMTVVPYLLAMLVNAKRTTA
jgi:hypothetical protein